MIRIIDMTQALSDTTFTFAVWDTVRNKFITDDYGDATWTIEEFKEQHKGVALNDFRRRVVNLAEGYQKHGDRALIAEMLAVLKELEWDREWFMDIEEDEEPLKCCPICGSQRDFAKRPETHKDDCKLAAVIAKAELGA